MMTETVSFDATKYLAEPDAQAVFLHDALDTGDAGYVTHALGVIVRARGMSQVARDAGLSREALCEALSPTGHLTLSTFIEITKALNIQLSALSV